MTMLWALIIGLAVGAFAKLFMPGREPGGLVITMLLGVAGALVAAYLGRSLGWCGDTMGTPEIVTTLLGSVFLLVVYRALLGRAPA